MSYVLVGETKVSKQQTHRTEYGVDFYSLLKVSAAGSQSHDNHDSKGTPRVSVAIISVKQLILQLMFFC